MLATLLGFAGFLVLIARFLWRTPNRSGSSGSAINVSPMAMPGAETTFFGTHVSPPSVDFSSDHGAGAGAGGFTGVDTGGSSVGGSWGGGDSSFGGGGAGGDW
jgi:uncharacterized membrane protein YgcG